MVALSGEELGSTCPAAAVQLSEQAGGYVAMECQRRRAADEPSLKLQNSLPVMIGSVHAAAWQCIDPSHLQTDSVAWCLPSATSPEVKGHSTEDEVQLMALLQQALARRRLQSLAE